MAEFRLGRIRFVWKGTWISGAEYFVDDVIRYGGKSYICVQGHTADDDFYTDLNIVPTKWNLIADGSEWKDAWAADEFYKVGDIVRYGGLLYICNQAHTSNSDSTLSLEADQGKWDVYAEGFDWKGDWTSSPADLIYKKNDLVKYGGKTFVCAVSHSPQSTLEADIGKWDEFNAGIRYIGVWDDLSVGTRILINDVVRFGSGLFIATAYHEKSASFESDANNFGQFVKGFEFEREWSADASYQPGDVVTYGGYQYISKTTHSSQTPTQSSENWDLFNEGFKFENDWEFGESYKVGSVVRLGGYTYVATADTISETALVTETSSADNSFTIADTSNLVSGTAVRFTSPTIGNVFEAGDSSESATYYVKSILSSTKFTISTEIDGVVYTPTTDTGSMPVRFASLPPDGNYWERLNSGIRWQGEWQDDVQYFLGDAVRFNSNAYICLKNHRSNEDADSTIGPQGGGNANSRPDLDSSGTYWDIIAIGNETSVLSEVGDLVYLGGSGPTRLPVGTEGQILTVNSTAEPEWRTLGRVDNLYYVSTDGVDGPAPVNGLTQDKPFRTIRYAAEQVENGIKVPNARRLIELNREFIKREIVEWVNYQIANDITPFSSAFDYDDSICERDMGYLIDAIVFDLTHGGNVKTVAAAQSYFTPGGASYIEGQTAETVAAINYGVTLIENVLNQVAPEENYQVLNGDNSTAIVEQFFDPTITAETDYTNNPFSGTGYDGSGASTTYPGGTTIPGGTGGY